MTTEEVINKILKGDKLFQYKSFRMSGQSFNSKVLPGNTITYKFEDNTRVHHSIGKSLLKKGILIKGSSSKTLGGWQIELLLK